MSATPCVSYVSLSFEDFLSPLDPVLLRTIFQNRIPGVDPQDIAQDARLGLWREWLRHRGTNGIRSPEGLTRTIAYRACLRHLRRATRERGRLTFSTEIADELLNDHCDVLDEVVRREDRDSLLAAIDRLPAVYREMLHRRFFRQETFNQIGRALEIDTSTACRRVQRALEVLNKHARIQP